MFRRTVVATALAAAASVGLTGAASAAILYYSGNECDGFSFQTCEYDGSPTIIKFDTDGAVEDQNNLFPSVTLADFSFFDVTYKNNDPSEDIVGWSFTYTPGIGDPAITALAVKGGTSYKVYTAAEFAFDGTTFSGIFNTSGLLNNGGKQPGLSHFTFFDTGLPVNEVPVPAAGLLLLGGIGALGAMRRRKV